MYNYIFYIIIRKMIKYSSSEVLLQTMPFAAGDIAADRGAA